MCKLLKVLSGVLRKVGTLIRKRRDGDNHDRFCKNKGAKKPRLEFDDFIDDASLQCDLALLLPVKEKNTGPKYCNEAVSNISSGPPCPPVSNELSPPVAQNVCRIASSLEEFSHVTANRNEIVIQPQIFGSSYIVTNELSANHVSKEEI